MQCLLCLLYVLYFRLFRTTIVVSGPVPVREFAELRKLSQIQVQGNQLVDTEEVGQEECCL